MPRFLYWKFAAAKMVDGKLERLTPWMDEDAWDGIIGMYYRSLLASTHGVFRIRKAEDLDAFAAAVGLTRRIVET